MKHDTDRSDGLLIAGVAGCVVAGAAAIALFGSLSVGDPDPASAAPRTAAIASEVVVDPTGEGPMLASLTPPGPVAAPSEVGRFETFPEVEVEPPATCDRPDGESLVDAGLQAWKARDYATASACFDDARAAIPDRPWIEYMAALALWKNGALDAADDAMVNALALDGDCLKCALNLSRIRNDAGVFEGALDAARAALAIDPSDADAMFLEGRSLRNLGRSVEAIDVLRAAVRNRPDHGHARNLLGLTLLEADRELEAVVELEVARDLLPEIAFVRNNLGMAYERAGDRAAAVVEYRTGAELDGRDGKAANNLARLDPHGTIEAGVLMATIDPVDETVVASEPDEASSIEVVAVMPDSREDADGTDPGTGPGVP